MQGLNNISNNVSTSLTQGVDGLGFVPPMSSKAGNAFDIDYVKVKDILTDEKNFQNRQDKYSEKSVSAIIKAVKNGAFNWFAFDPVLLWQNGKGQLFILSGHSRTEAFRRLAKEKPQIIIDGLTFDRIPAKIFKGDFVSAKNLALNSNALSTPETLLERADYYRKLRENAKGNDALKKLREKALRENQGGVIWDLSYIPKGGLTDDFLRRFKMQEDSEGAFENYIRAVSIAQWIGKAFQIYKGLGKIHDTELFNFLFENYGTKSGQYNSFAKLNERLAVLYPRNVKNDKKIENGIYTTPFGLQVFAKTDEEIKDIEDLKKLAESAKRDLKRKIEDLRGRTTDKEKVFEIITPYFNQYINALLDWWRQLDNERKRQEDKNQTSLFGLGAADVVNDLFNEVQQLKMDFEKLKSDYNDTYFERFKQRLDRNWEIEHKFDDFINNEIFKIIWDVNEKRVLSNRWKNTKIEDNFLEALRKEIFFYLSAFPFGSAKYKNALSYVKSLFADYPKKRSLIEIITELRTLNDLESFRQKRPVDFDRDSVEYWSVNFDDYPTTKIIDFHDVRKVKANTLGSIDLSKKQPSAIFNCPEDMLQCGGFVPTYQRVNDYSQFIDAADGIDKFVGIGFDKTTLDTLVTTCQKYYPQVAKLAKHLQDPHGDELQTCFNIWHWEHVNLRYNYDAEGKEEIRTPARTWHDRNSGVDCDCLAVFTACLLLNLGYSPSFEIVGFGNSNKYSHIFVNLNGAAIDRVLPIFLQRAPLITKTLIMEIPVYQLSGLGEIPLQLTQQLNGIYQNSLSKVFTHTATPEEYLNFRKTQVLVTLGNIDTNAFKLAGIIMPYVDAIDDEGAFYFENGEIAKIAADGENKLAAMEARGASDAELQGLFKKIKKAVKKVANKVGNAVKTVAKSTAKAVKTVAKATANTVKAAAKSTANAVKATANVVKAGAQAVTGNASKAKETLKKAGSQVKAAVVQPVKQAVKDTKSVAKDAVAKPIATAVKVTVVNPTVAVAKAATAAVKTAIQIGKKLFKVIFIKLNPVTILIRNSLRLLIAINFLGMASRLNVANMTKEQAIAEGYSAENWEDAKKSLDKVIRFFTKMGGKQSNIEKAVKNGAKKKPIFKGGYNKNSKIVETGDDDAQLSGVAPQICGLDGLGAALTIGSALAAVGAFFAKIWGWVKNIVPKIGKGVATAAKAVGQKVVEVGKEALTNAKDAAIDTLKNKINPQQQTDETVVVDNTVVEEKKQFDWKKYLPWILGGAAVLTIGGVAIARSKKKRA